MTSSQLPGPHAWGGHHQSSAKAPRMTRRLSTCGALLVCGVCILMLLASHLLTGTASLERTPFLEVGRALQVNTTSWSNNEVDAEETVLAAAAAANYTKEVADAVNEQRQFVADEMEDYQFPNGMYNISAKSLADLVPEMGGQPIRNIIITTWRSGSTFLGDVLNSHPANYYHYEPLLHYGIMQIRNEPLANGAIHDLKSLLNCNYTELSHYLDYGKDHLWLFMHNTRLWYQCEQRPHICWMPEFLIPFCRLFPFQSMKVVRMRLHLAEELLVDPSLNVRVLLLVRDPRGTLQSRRHREWCPGNPDCMYPARLCSDLVADYGAAVHLSTKYPQRFRVVRYEDLSVEPYLGVRTLFQFFGLDFHPRVQQFLDTHTKVDIGGVSSTYRNSKSAPFHWRQDLSYADVHLIQKACIVAMEHWGYLPAFNSTHQREFNPLRKFSLT